MAGREVALGPSSSVPARRERGARASRADADFVVGRAGADLQGPRIFTHLLLFIIIAFCAIFLVWASWAELDEVTRGDGRVIPSSQEQVVQNLEGGILAGIEVREGAVVDQGQVLLRIDNVKAASDLRENRQRHLALLGTLARLRAEVEGTPISLPPEVLAEAGDVAANERALYDARRQALEAEVQILRDQAEQRQQELAELKNRRDQLVRSLALATEESPNVRYVHLDWALDDLMGTYLTNSAPEQFLLRQEDVWLEVRGARGELHMNRLSHADFVARLEGRRQ